VGPEGRRFAATGGEVASENSRGRVREVVLRGACEREQRDAREKERERAKGCTCVSKEACACEQRAVRERVFTKGNIVVFTPSFTNAHLHKMRSHTTTAAHIGSRCFLGFQIVRFHKSAPPRWTVAGGVVHIWVYHSGRPSGRPHFSPANATTRARLAPRVALCEHLRRLRDR